LTLLTEVQVFEAYGPTNYLEHKFCLFIKHMVYRHHVSLT
jgi:hypothetical protein